jgi:hypothetical protein
VIGRRRLKGMDGACVLAVALHRRHQQGPGRETPAERGRERVHRAPHRGCFGAPITCIMNRGQYWTKLAPSFFLRELISFLPSSNF